MLKPKKLCKSKQKAQAWQSLAYIKLQKKKILIIRMSLIINIHINITFSDKIRENYLPQNSQLLIFFCYIQHIFSQDLSFFKIVCDTDYYIQMSNIAQKFYSLRVYKKLSTYDIANLILCNRLMKVSPFVANSPKIYKYSNRLFGSKLTNYLINNTFCKALTAGNTLDQAEKVAARFRNQNIPVIFDYCAEGVVGEQGSEDALDENAKLFLQSAQKVCNNQSQMISIKITALVDMELLKRINDSVVRRNQFWQKYSENGSLSSLNMFKGLQNIYSGISDEHFRKYLKAIYNYEGTPEQFSIDETQFKMKHLPYYIGDIEQQKNYDFIIRLFLPLNRIDRQKLESLRVRLETICNPFIVNKSQFKILVDAQQSYVQRAIEVISEQLQEIYNKQRLYKIKNNSNQCYEVLKRSFWERH